MPVATRIPLSRPARLVIVVVAAVLAAGVAAPPARAHTSPKSGATCAMSGMTRTVHGMTYVCTTTMGSTARWGRGLPVSKSALTLSDGWVKAARSGMTAAFGVLTNPTSTPIRVIGAYSRVNSPALQLHEVVMQDGAMVMQQKGGGYVIPPGGTLELKPGGNHIMLMDLKRPLSAGDMVRLTLVTADGGLLKVRVMAKVYAGANETYNGQASGMSGM